MMPTAVSSGREKCSGIAWPIRIAAPANTNSVSVWPSPHVRPCFDDIAEVGSARRNTRHRRDVIGFERMLHSQQKADPQNSEHKLPDFIFSLGDRENSNLGGLAKVKHRRADKIADVLDHDISRAANHARFFTARASFFQDARLALHHAIAL
jgi:hypothetical protein